MKLQITYHCDSNVCLLQFTPCCLTKEVSGCVVKAPQMTAYQVSLLTERATHPSLQTFENSKILGRSQLKQIRLFKLLLTTDLFKLKSLPTGLFVHHLTLSFLSVLTPASSLSPGCLMVLRRTAPPPPRSWPGRSRSR